MSYKPSDHCSIHVGTKLNWATGECTDCTKGAAQVTATIPKLPGEHDDLCVWWDNVGKEPLDYACTCGVSHRAMLTYKAALWRAVEALENLVAVTTKYGPRQPLCDTDILWYANEARAALDEIRESGFEL